MGEQDNRLASYSTGEYKISDPIGNLPYRIDFNDGAAFETLCRSEIESCFKKTPSQFRWRIHALESSRKWVIAVVLLLPVLVFAFLKYGLPEIAEIMAPKIPVEVLAHLDTQVIDSFDDSEWLTLSTASSAHSKMLERAWFGFGDTSMYNLLQRNGEYFGANAFALPGGTIVVTDQLLEILNDEQQIAAVLAHEMGHVELHHGTRNIIQSMGVATTFSVLIGDVGFLAESILVVAPTLLQQMSYSREFEREADRFAIERLEEIGISAGCLAASLNAILHSGKETEEEQTSKEQQSTNTPKDKPSSKVQRLLNYLSTHPAMEERIAAVGGDRCN